MLALMEQNRLREQQMVVIVAKLLDQNRSSNEFPKTTTVPSFSQTVPTFSGETGDTDLAIEWINALKTASLLNRWSKTCTLKAARSHIEGAAKHWYLSHMSEMNTCEKFITSFEIMFTGKENLTESLKKMKERVQKESEPVFTYFHEKVRLCRRLGLYPTETKKMVCIGLRSKDMCAALLSRYQQNRTIPVTCVPNAAQRCYSGKRYENYYR